MYQVSVPRASDAPLPESSVCKVQTLNSLPVCVCVFVCVSVSVCVYYIFAGAPLLPTSWVMCTIFCLCNFYCL
jgi:hypothetical protein